MNNVENNQPIATPQVVIQQKTEDPKKVVCEVCGHANPEYTAICKMCSNYLQRR